MNTKENINEKMFLLFMLKIEEHNGRNRMTTITYFIKETLLRIFCKKKNKILPNNFSFEVI